MPRTPRYVDRHAPYWRMPKVFRNFQDYERHARYFIDPNMVLSLKTQDPSNEDIRKLEQLITDLDTLHRNKELYPEYDSLVQMVEQAIKKYADKTELAQRAADQLIYNVRVSGPQKMEDHVNDAYLDPVDRMFLLETPLGVQYRKTARHLYQPYADDLEELVQEGRAERNRENRFDAMQKAAPKRKPTPKKKRK